MMLINEFEALIRGLITDKDDLDKFLLTKGILAVVGQRDFPHKPKELTILYKILIQVRPQITLVEYLDLETKIVGSHLQYESDYYGYGEVIYYKQVSIEDLYGYLMVRGWLSWPMKTL